jgi:hypothetical protein
MMPGMVGPGTGNPDRTWPAAAVEADISRPEPIASANSRALPNRGRQLWASDFDIFINVPRITKNGAQGPSMRWAGRHSSISTSPHGKVLLRARRRIDASSRRVGHRRATSSSGVALNCLADSASQVASAKSIPHSVGVPRGRCTIPSSYGDLDGCSDRVIRVSATHPSAEPGGDVDRGAPPTGRRGRRALGSERCGDRPGRRCVGAGPG